MGKVSTTRTPRAPKYSRPELERRWVVDPANLPALVNASARRIVDKYVDGGELRLRTVEEAGAPPVFKLGKKYPASGPVYRPIVNVYLSEAEYASLDKLAGRCAQKVRHPVAGGAIDVYERPAHPFAIFEIEFDTFEQAVLFDPPGFVGTEVTFDPAYSGFALADGPVLEGAHSNEAPTGTKHKSSSIPFETARVSDAPIATAPDGSDVRSLLRLSGGSMAHFHFAAGETSRAIVHRSVDEIWLVISGGGDLWRRTGSVEEVVTLAPGICVTIPCGTAFQVQAASPEGIVAVGITMPPWAGDDEAVETTGWWPATE